jgi:hypothetical protein
MPWKITDVGPPITYNEVPMMTPFCLLYPEERRSILFRVAPDKEAPVHRVPDPIAMPNLDGIYGYIDAGSANAGNAAYALVVGYTWVG